MLQASDHLHNERILLGSLKSGDWQAFDAIYNHYSRELFIKAYHKVGVKEICEDLIQDLFTELWSKREQLEIRQSLSAYLHGTMNNKIIDYYRQACMKLRHVDRLIQLFDQQPVSAVDRITYKEQESALHAYIDGLSEKMRAVFVMSRYEQLSTHEISQRLNLSGQTVRNQISKALKILRTKFS